MLLHGIIKTISLFCTLLFNKKYVVVICMERYWAVLNFSSSNYMSAGSTYIKELNTGTELLVLYKWMLLCIIFNFSNYYLKLSHY